MRVLLVGAELEENLALRYLAAVLEPLGHVVAFATFDNASQASAVLAETRRTRPDLVGMSMTFQFRAKEFGALAAALRADGYRGHITCGGHFPTFAWREVLEAFPAIDTVVRHEGEETLPELCSALARRDVLAGVRGVAYRTHDGAIVANAPRPLIADLDALPFPKRIGEPQMHLGIPAAFLVGTRGCYGHCTFCCIHAYLKSAGGPKYRLRSADNVAEEMAALREQRGARMFVFHDDDFFTRDHAHDLARMTALRNGLRRRGIDDIAVVVKARPDDVDDDVFDVLEQIGLLRVYLGIESGSAQGLKVLGRGVDVATNRRALARLRARDIYTCFNMLVFDPESTLEALRESFAFLRENATVPMNFCRTEIYVGTPLMTKLQREGRLIGDVFGWDYAIRDPRADRAFRIFAQAFLDRNFRCDGLMNSTLGLGYHLHLLRTFYPRAMRPALRTLVDDTTRRVNLDGVTWMSAILDFAASPAAEDVHALEDFSEATRQGVAAANRRLEAEVEAATDEIMRAAFAPRRARAVSRWGALSAATLVLAPLGCEKQPPPPDPLPQPTVVDTLPPPPDPLPPPVIDAGTTESDGGTTDAGVKTPPPPDPLPPPTVKPKLLPPDPLPRPHTK